MKPLKPESRGFETPPDFLRDPGQQETRSPEQGTVTLGQRLQSDIRMASNGLPGSLFEFYAFYKKGTRALISWLSANGTNVTERTYVKSVEELKYLANTVISRRIQMSASLLRDLKDTVRARTRVSKFFKSLAKPGDQEQTSSHEYFTATLLQIHEEFQQLAKSAKTSSVSSPVTSTKPPSNVFEHLQNDKRTNNDHGSPTSPRRVTPTESVDQPSRPDEVSRMKSDDIGEFMALAMYLSVCRLYDIPCPKTDSDVSSNSRISWPQSRKPGKTWRLGRFPLW